MEKTTEIQLPLPEKTLKAIDVAISCELAANTQDFILSAVKEKIVNLGLNQQVANSTTTDFETLIKLAKSMIAPIDVKSTQEAKKLSIEYQFCAFLRHFFMKNDNQPVALDSVLSAAEAVNFEYQKAKELIKYLLTDGFLYSPKPGFIKRLL